MGIIVIEKQLDKMVTSKKTSLEMDGWIIIDVGVVVLNYNRGLRGKQK